MQARRSSIGRQAAAFAKRQTAVNCAPILAAVGVPRCCTIDFWFTIGRRESVDARGPWPGWIQTFENDSFEFSGSSSAIRMCLYYCRSLAAESVRAWPEKANLSKQQPTGVTVRAASVESIMKSCAQEPGALFWKSLPVEEIRPYTNACAVKTACAGVALAIFAPALPELRT